MKTKKYRLAKWSILCQPKDQGGIGILDLNTMNRALLSKWLYKLLNSDGMWQQLLRNKYIGSKSLAQVEWKIGDSHFWSCLMKVKPDFLHFGTFLVNDGSQVRFWEDSWLDGSPLKDQYHSLYNITRPKSITIAEAMSSFPPNFSWRRQLYGSNLVDWISLLSRIEGLELSHDRDTFYWNLTPNGKFSVKSFYTALKFSTTPNVNRDMWKMKAPLKIKLFLWYLRKGVILTKDNLAKRNWHGSLTCVFCHKEETINHLFFECRLARSVWNIVQMATGFNPPHNVEHMFGGWLLGLNKILKSVFLLGAAVLCWALWTGRNDLVFEKKLYCSPLQVILSASQCLSRWAILQRKEVRPMVVTGSRTLVRVAMAFFSRRHGWRSRLRIGYH